MENLVALFRISGAAAVFFLLTAAASGFWGAKLRKILSPQVAMKLHRGLGIAGVLSGMAHGLIYWLFLR
jgi:hypothetical protein